MKIGDKVTYQGRLYVLRGFDPVSVSPRHVYLEETESGETVVVLLDDIERDEP